MPNESTKAGRSSTASLARGRSFLGVLAPVERAVVLDRLLASHRDLLAEAEQASQELLESVAVEEVADELSRALARIRLEDLGARAGRVRGRGYVHETDAAWELVNEVMEPLVADVRRRAGAGLLDAAGMVVVGIVAGLHAVRAPEDGSVLAYAGPDAPTELAGQVLTEANRLGVEIPDDAPGAWWPTWTDLG